MTGADDGRTDRPRLPLGTGADPFPFIHPRNQEPSFHSLLLCTMRHPFG